MEKEIVETIRYKSETTWFYKIDKYFKIIKIKIENIEEEKETDYVRRYKVAYKFGVNLINPFSWIYILFVWIRLISKATKELFEDIKFSTYVETIKIKK
ncbi:hypothetical protein [uncultured Clostridium sp.]|uniref:hypothetical protein n=1 Tax=uncultured Clostridium sp. TaxID=59620 RepID=UPI0027DB901D|nr:hypothetical protein [uncultured Clostridium sp.]